MHKITKVTVLVKYQNMAKLMCQHAGISCSPRPKIFLICAKICSIRWRVSLGSSGSDVTCSKSGGFAASNSKHQRQLLFNFVFVVGKH